ncbi:MAG: biotin--[acetyl-CoA-carboxylase] ligase [Gammaproteobacteria bacterium]|nr:biotin--[acetyl-CoA-carboxylase] ligase [Gammaproteobacteria bacterium]MDH5591924.1 biotin--[acetyl-CoA-carboxylase] ligase [Gammaproteobacteria bacterium]
MTSPDFPALSITEIQSVLEQTSASKLDDILLHTSVPSTNDELWKRLAEGKTTPAVCLSESQTAGRGRRGDHWHSPHAGNLYLSIFWPFPAEMTKNGLSIAIGISLINTLKDEGINGLQLKWPNDILYKRQKLAGILVESRFGIKQHTVIGIGLNFKLPAATKNQIQQPTISLQQLCTTVPCRNRLAGKIIHNMIETLELFQHSGLNHFLPQWPNYDALADQTITLISDHDKLTVQARGINDQGELRYQHNNMLHTLSNSHVSIRFSS